MAKAVVARMEGDDYQARFFWLQVCRLFEPHTKVSSVGYEVDDARAFDDVVVSYAPPVNDDRGGVVATDYYQVKFHVSQVGTVRFESLMDPAFIGATRFSFLQRLRNAYLKTRDQGSCRFILVTPWVIDASDPLARLINNNAGQLHLDRLYDGGGPRSKMGALRQAAAEHLQIDQELLREILATLRIEYSSGTLADLNSRLGDKLALAGMKPVALTATASVYDDLIRKLLESGRNSFTAEEIQEICQREELWVGHVEPPDYRADLGIRSFVRRTEYMEDETMAVLDLVPYFNGRKIHDASLWSTCVCPEVVRFLETSAKTGRSYRLRVDAHTSIAVLAGYTLDTKAGVKISLVQKTRNGVEVWDVAQRAGEPGPLWEFTSSARGTAGGDLAVAVSVTHDVCNDLEVFLSGAGLPVGELVTATIAGPGNTAVQGGRHALDLALSLVSELRAHRNDGRTVHLFIAAPNGFSFVLGQHLRGFGPVIVYEFDFESGSPGAYEVGIVLPPADIAAAQS